MSDTVTWIRDEDGKERPIQAKQKFGAWCEMIYLVDKCENVDYGPFVGLPDAIRYMETHDVDLLREYTIERTLSFIPF